MTLHLKWPTRILAMLAVISIPLASTVYEVWTAGTLALVSYIAHELARLMAAVEYDESDGS